MEKSIPRNPFKYDHKTMTDGVKNTQHSETIPNQTLSMAEMVEKYVRGDNIPGLKNYDYDTEETLDLPEIGKMSTIDRARYLSEVKEDIDHNSAQLKQINAEKAARKANEKLLNETPAETPNPNDPKES